MVRKKSAHAKTRGWDRVGANQVLMILCDRRHVEQNDGAERVERSTCDGNRARSAAAVTVVCGASSAVKRVSAARAEATSSLGGDESAMPRLSTKKQKVLRKSVTKL